MPIEIRIKFGRGTMILPDIIPGAQGFIQDCISDSIVVLECNENDDGGVVGRVNSDAIDIGNGKFPEFDMKDATESISIQRNGKHIDYIGVSPLAPLMIGELTLKHV